MRKFALTILFMLTAGMLFPAFAAEEKSLDTALEEYAQKHGEKLNSLLDWEEYLNWCVAPMYSDDGGVLLETLSSIDFTDPRKMLVLIKPREEIELLRDAELTGEERQMMEEHAFTEVCLMPLSIPRVDNKLYVRRVLEDLIIRSAAAIPEIDGAAYVIQLYDGIDGKESPFLVTAFIASEQGIVLVHSEIVCGTKGTASVEDCFVNLMLKIDSCIGEVGPEEVIQRTYRERP